MICVTCGHTRESTRSLAHLRLGGAAGAVLAEVEVDVMDDGTLRLVHVAALCEADSTISHEDALRLRDFLVEWL